MINSKHWWHKKTCETHIKHVCDDIWNFDLVKVQYHNQIRWTKAVSTTSVAANWSKPAYVTSSHRKLTLSCSSKSSVDGVDDKPLMLTHLDPAFACEICCWLCHSMLGNRNSVVTPALLVREGALGRINVWHDNGLISLNKSTKPHSHPLLINCSAAVETQLNSTDLGIMCAEPPHRL